MNAATLPLVPPHLATPATLTTERLVLRPWRDSDLVPFAALKDWLSCTQAMSIPASAILGALKVSMNQPR